MTTNTTAAQDLGTSAGGRAYLAEYFATQLRRHDFARYIANTLAADFACALAQHLSKLRAPVAAPSAETLRLTGVIADKIEDGTLFQAGIFSRRELADKVRAVMRFAQQSAHVADERAVLVSLSSLHEEAGKMARSWSDNLRIFAGPPTDDEIDAYEEGYLACALSRRSALASAPVAGEAQRLDAPAQVGGTRFGRGIHWSTVIHAAQRHHEYMQDPAREAARIAQAKQFQALVAGDAAPQASEAVRDARDMDELRSRVLGAIHGCADLKPEEDETWEEWYCAAFDLLGSRVGDILSAALSAQPGAQKEQSDAN